MNGIQFAGLPCHSPYLNGFSPYELVHGCNLRGPLEAMKTGWVKCDLSFTGIVECENKIRETLTTLHQAAYENEEVYNEQRLHMI